jgi:phytoene dehydrogenase-like protein
MKAAPAAGHAAGPPLVGAPVERIIVKRGRVTGVVVNGREIPADVVVSSADPRTTFLDLLEPGHLAPEFSLAVRNIRCRGVAARVVIELDGPGVSGVMFDGPSVDHLERAYDATKYGRISDRPWIEARAEGTRIEAHVQYVPAKLKDWNEAARQQLGRQAVEAVERQHPGTATLVKSSAVSGPADLAGQGLTEGQPYHAELGLDQILFMRPVAGWSRYRTPIEGLYLCGAGTHPGGALAGASGWLAAGEIQRRMRET